MKSREGSAQNSIFFPSSGIFKPDVSLSKCQSQGFESEYSNPIDRPLRMSITKSHRFQLLRADNMRSGMYSFFFSGEGESRPDRQTCIEIWRWHNLKPARAR